MAFKDARNIETAPDERLFSQIVRMIPTGQEVLSLDVGTSAMEALQLMRDNNFSHLPVKSGGSVLGLFSYRSFSREIARRKKATVIPSEVPVEECLDKATFRLPSDELSDIMDILDRDDVVLIGRPERVQGILTSSDALRYMSALTSIYVLLQESEILLRHLIEASTSPEQLVACSESALKNFYDNRPIPTRVDEMTFGDYIAILDNRDNWPYFERAFGNRRRTRDRLENIRTIRNAAFHFRTISLDAHEDLAAFRNWLLARASTIEAATSHEA